VAIGKNPKLPERFFVKYFLPRRPIQGTTADGSRFELLYGRLLITTVKDKEGRRRTAALIRDQKGRWEQRFLDVLWRTPSEKELRENDNLQAVNSVLERFEVLEEWDAGSCTLRLSAYPSHGTESLLVMSPRLLCVNDAIRLRNLKYSKSWRMLKEIHNSQEYFFSDVRLIDFDNSVFDSHRDKYIPSPIEAGVRSSLPPSQWVTRDSSKLSFSDDLFMLRLMVNDVIQQGDAGICRLRVLTSKEWESKTKPTGRGWLSRSPSEFFPEKYYDFTGIYSHIDKIITEESND
jgi:hypothetical protein